MDALWTARLSPRTGNGRSHAPRHGAFETPAGRPDGSVVAECAPPGAGAGAPACGCVRDGGSRGGVQLGRRPRSPCPCFGSAVALAAPTRSRLRQAVSPEPGRVPACTLHWGLRGNRPGGFTLAAGTTVLWACMSAPFAHTVHTRTAQYKRACMHGCMCTCLCTHTHMHPQHMHIHVRAVHTCTHLQDVHTFLHTVCTLLMNIRMHKRRCTYLRAHAHASHTRALTEPLPRHPRGGARRSPLVCEAPSQPTPCAPHPPRLTGGVC